VIVLCIVFIPPYDFIFKERHGPSGQMGAMPTEALAMPCCAENALTLRIWSVEEHCKNYA
jgi:hypothetical protein